MLVAAYWIAWALGWLWRRSIWDVIAHEALALGGDVRPLWLGWRLQVGDLRVDWTGGLSGHGTRVRRGQHKLRVDGLLTAEQIRQTS